MRSFDRTAATLALVTSVALAAMTGCVAQAGDEASGDEAVGSAQAADQERLGECAAACTEETPPAPEPPPVDHIIVNCNCPQQPAPAPAPEPPPPQTTQPPPVAEPPPPVAPPIGCAPPIGFAPPIGCAPPIVCAPPIACASPCLPFGGIGECGLPGGFLYVGQFGNYIGIPVGPLVNSCL